MRAGLRAVLSSDDDDRGRRRGRGRREAVDAAGPPAGRRPDGRPDARLDGIAATREVLAASPESRSLILTTFEQDDYIFGALRAGASGFLLKRTGPEELIAAIHTIAAGDSLLSPSVTRPRGRAHGAARSAPIARRAARRAHPARARGARAVARGLSNAEIAAELVIEQSRSRPTCKRVLMKLGLATACRR